MIELSLAQLTTLDKICAIVATASLFPKLPQDPIKVQDASALIREIREMSQNETLDTIKSVKKRLI